MENNNRSLTLFCLVLSLNDYSVVTYLKQNNHLLVNNSGYLIHNIVISNSQLNSIYECLITWIHLYKT